MADPTATITELTPRQIETLGQALDRLIPPAPAFGLPGAGELGLAREVAAAISPNLFLLALLVRALDALAAAAARRGAADFGALAETERAAAFEEIANAEPDFVGALLFPTYVAYYQNPRVRIGLGQEARPPFPEGYRLPPFDESLLAPVRERRPVRIRDPEAGRRGAR